VSDVSSAERIAFFRRADFPAVELLSAEDTPRTWTIFNTGFAFAALRSWHGQVDYRRQRAPVGPGAVFCSEPGEVHSAVPGSGGAGSFQVVHINPGTFEEQCRAEGMRGSVHLAAFVVDTGSSSVWASALGSLREAIQTDASALELQSRLAVFVHASAQLVLERSPRPRARPVVGGTVEHLREMLHSDEGARVVLVDFARRAGVSQFQLLRAFKRRYGLPPHAYELNMRLERARQMLRRGVSATDAAAANDFTDQSHFTRHFRRMWGMTPGQYAR
jgi:AraC-like DNA-binding protein